MAGRGRRESAGHDQFRPGGELKKGDSQMNADKCAAETPSRQEQKENSWRPGVLAADSASPGTSMGSCLWRLQHRYAPQIFISPFFILFAVFLFYPLTRSLYLSFCATIGPRHVRFIGLGNYAHLIHDPYFWLSTGRSEERRV